MKCNQASQFISLACEQKLAFNTRAQLQFHLWICSRCRAFKRNNDKLSSLIREYCEREEGG